ncbi:MAG: hypothetical protein AAF717_05375 [Bacteroidota bacterium]
MKILGVTVCFYFLILLRANTVGHAQSVQNADIRQPIIESGSLLKTVESKEYFAFNAKTQFPIQHALGIEYLLKGGLSFNFSLGQLSRAYTVTATNFLSAEDENQAQRKQFIEDKMKNGLVAEFGANFYPENFRDFYFGTHIQFQRFTLPATPEELVENYGFADQIDQNELEENLNNELVQLFYENTIIEPIVKPIQLGAMFGKKFSFSKIPNFLLMVELSYHFNLTTRTKFDSASLVGRVIVDAFIEPNFDASTVDSFGSFNLPSLAIRLQYRIATTKQPGKTKEP